MDHVSYSKLYWWGQRNEDVDVWAKAFLQICTAGPSATRRSYVQPTLYLENGHSRGKVRNSQASAESRYTPTCMDPALLPIGQKRELTYRPKANPVKGI